VGNLEVRQGVPLIDGGTVRLPRLVGEGRSVALQEGKSEREALKLEYENSVGVLAAEGRAGAARFAAGAGRHGAKAD
jgi:enoyl-CoA hydratase